MTKEEETFYFTIFYDAEGGGLSMTFHLNVIYVNAVLKPREDS
jgi:hypothetical protein